MPNEQQNQLNHYHIFTEKAVK